MSRLLLLLLILSLPFTEVVSVPVSGGFLHLPEILALLFILSVLPLLRRRSFFALSGLDKGVLFFLGGLLILGYGYPGSAHYFNLFASFYLVVLYFMISRYLWFSKTELQSFILQAFIWAGGLAGLAGITGWLVSWYRQQEIWTLFLEEYPYLGEVYRATGFNKDPNFLAVFLILSLAALMVQVLKNKKIRWWEWWVACLIAVAFLLTYSKAIFILFAVLFFLAGKFAPKRKSWMRGGTAIMILLFLLFSHIIIIKKGPGSSSLPAYRQYAPVLYETERYALVKSYYWILKESCLEAAWRKFPRGSGIGGHAAFTERLKEEGRYPEPMPGLDPHSVYFGMPAELGIGGILLAGWLIIVIVRALNRAKRRVAPARIQLLYFLQTVMVVWALEAIVIDNLRYRHYWVLLGVLGALLYKLNAEAAKTQRKCPPRGGGARTLAPFACRQSFDFFAEVATKAESEGTSFSAGARAGEE